LCYHRPETVLEAKFSLEYCVAIALLEGEVRLKHFLDDSWLKKKEVQELIQKARYEHPADIGTGMDLPQEVVIITKSGEQYSKRVTQYETKGHPDNPMTEEELLAKYKDCAGYVLSDTSINTSAEILRNLESLDSISDLLNTYKKD
jgi:2-methylcitrate dehydratase PrpD